MPRVRVLHVIKTLNLGGAETNLFNLVRAFNHGRVENHVAYSFGGEIEARFRAGGVRLFKYAEGSHRLKSPATLAIIARLARYVRRHRIDVVHTHIFNAHVWGGIAAKVSGAKLLEHVHDFRYLEDAQFRLRRGENNQYRYARFLRGMSDAVVVLTRQNRDFLVKHGVCPPHRVREIQNGIPLDGVRTVSPETRRVLKAELGLAEDSAVVLTTARVAPEKNIDLILRTAPRLSDRFPRAVFVVSGDGPRLEECREHCRRAGLEPSVRFIGFHQNVYDLLAVADVFLLPSFLELHSISILEAMSAGVPVVASSGVGCNDEFIRSWENGVLLDPFIDEGWAEALERLLRDPKERREIGEEGRRTVRDRFDIRKVAGRFEELYAELSGRRRVRASLPDSFAEPLLTVAARGRLDAV